MEIDDPISEIPSSGKNIFQVPDASCQAARFTPRNPSTLLSVGPIIKATSFRLN